MVILISNKKINKAYVDVKAEFRQNTKTDRNSMKKVVRSPIKHKDGFPGK